MSSVIAWCSSTVQPKIFRNKNNSGSQKTSWCKTMIKHNTNNTYDYIKQTTSVMFIIVWTKCVYLNNVCKGLSNKRQLFENNNIHTKFFNYVFNNQIHFQQLNNTKRTLIITLTVTLEWYCKKNIFTPIYASLLKLKERDTHLSKYARHANWAFMNMKYISL